MIFCDMTNVFVPSNDLAVSQLLEPILNAHNKEEYPPMHTAEHILNGTTMTVRITGTKRSPRGSRKGQGGRAPIQRRLSG